MPSSHKKRIGLAVISRQKTVTCLANENKISRKFIRQQGKQAQVAIDNVFDKDNASNDDVLYYLPITKAWISQLVLALMLLRHASYRNVAMRLKDLFDYTISPATVNTISKQAVISARQVNATEDLSNIEVPANDELFHHNKPILSGVDTRSMYCYLLSSEDQRDEETWAIHL